MLIKYDINRIQHTSNQLILCANIPKMSVNRDGAAVCPVKDHSNRLPAVVILRATYTKLSHVGEIAVTLFLYGSGPLLRIVTRICA